MSENEMTATAFNDWYAVLNEWADPILAAEHLDLPAWTAVDETLKVRGNIFAREFLASLGFEYLPIEQFDLVCDKFINTWYEGFVTGILYHRNKENDNE